LNNDFLLAATLCFAEISQRWRLAICLTCVRFFERAPAVRWPTNPALKSSRSRRASPYRRPIGIAGFRS
jgi:hypothetical protein